MYSFKIQNEYNMEFALSEMPDRYQIISIAGIDPPNAQIYEVKNARMDGNVYNDASLEDRIITVTFSIEGPAEYNRMELYRYLKIKKKHRLFYQNGSRDVYIDGYLESLQISLFDPKELAQATFRCMDPYFKNTASITEDFSNTIRMFEFPFEIEEPIPFSEFVESMRVEIVNYGDVITGGVFTLQAIGTVVNPRISSLSTGEYFEFNLTLESGQEIIVNTIEKQKRVILRSGGTDTNAINYLTPGSDFIQIAPGINDFFISATEGAENLTGEVQIDTLYQGA